MTIRTYRSSPPRSIGSSTAPVTSCPAWATRATGCSAPAESHTAQASGAIPSSKRRTSRQPVRFQAQRPEDPSCFGANKGATPFARLQQAHVGHGATRATRDFTRTQPELLAAFAQDGTDARPVRLLAGATTPPASHRTHSLLVSPGHGDRPCPRP